MAAVLDPRVGTALVLDELLDLSLYRALEPAAGPGVRKTLAELADAEVRHLEFWQQLFGLRRERLDLRRRLKLRLLTLLGRLGGDFTIQLILEAIEVYGVRKYLALWEASRDGPLGQAIRGILEEELAHEDRLVSALAERRLNPRRIRDIFLGLNDGLVEMVGAVSGFFAALRDPVSILMATAATAVAGALSMGAGAWVAASSEQEVARTEDRRRRFLGQPVDALRVDRPWISALLVGVSYLAGALVPVLPVLSGVTGLMVPVLVGAGVAAAVSLVLAFLSGMSMARRVGLNLALLGAAVVVTYLIGTAARALWGVGV
jgi:VIT1/CCC1 family predicted Fe2+/Mn2+ transporter